MKRKIKPYFLPVFVFLGTILFCKVGPSQPKTGTESSFALAGKLLAATGNDKTKPALDRTLLYNLRPLIDEARICLGNSCVLPSEYLTVIVDSLALELSSKLFMVTDPGQIVSSLRKTVFEESGICCDRGNNEVKNILPHNVLRSRHGSSLGISLLLLTIGQKLDLPLHGVVTPEHFFVRFDNGRDRINIDPEKKGRSLADAWYRNRYAITDTSYFTLKNLETREVIAYVKYTIASIYRNHGLFAKAALYYESALGEMPEFADVYSCLGVTYDTLGQVDKSLAYFLRAKTLRGNHGNLSAQIGKVFLKRKNYAQAVVEYRNGLRDAPNSPELLYGLGLAYYHLNDFDNAYKQLMAAVNASDSIPEAEASEAYGLLALMCEKTGENKKAAQYRALAVSRQ
jgi:Uncharacterized conserved protein